MKILMVGLGGIGQRHVRNLRTLLGSSVELSAYRVRKFGQVVTERLQIEAGSDVEHKYNIQVYTELDQALAQGQDAVFICNPSSLHLPVALAAARAGCALFIEKPLSHNEDGLAELLDVVEQQRLVTMVGYQLRFHPCLQRIQALLGEQAIGQVLAVRAEVGEYLPGWHTYEDYRQMYAARPELGGGVILSQIHELDYLYWLFGLPRRVFALGGHLSSLEIEVEDVASILMECTVNGHPVPVQLHQDYVQRPPSRTCKIIGDAGKLVLDLRANTVEHYNTEGELVHKDEFADFERNQLFLDELTHFLDCMRERRPSMVTVHDGAQSLRMALAAKQSLATGEVIVLS